MATPALLRASRTSSRRKATACSGLMSHGDKVTEPPRFQGHGVYAILPHRRHGRRICAISTPCSSTPKSPTPCRAQPSWAALSVTSAARNADWIMGDYIERRSPRIRDRWADEEVILGLSGRCGLVGGRRADPSAPSATS